MVMLGDWKENVGLAMYHKLKGAPNCSSGLKEREKTPQIRSTSAQHISLTAGVSKLVVQTGSTWR